MANARTHWRVDIPSCNRTAPHCGDDPCIKYGRRVRSAHAEIRYCQWPHLVGNFFPLCERKAFFKVYKKGFTAVDDVKQDSDEEGDAGAAMIGDVEFNSATFYRYANVDVDRLLDTLGDANATVQAVTAFIDAFSTTVPNGKINTFAHNTLPDLVVVNLRDTQAVNLAGAFERPIAGDVVANATKALVEREQEIDASYGTTPVHTWVIRVGKDTEAADQLAARQPLRDVLTELGDAIASRLVQE